jgi:hypothetical protein
MRRTLVVVAALVVVVVGVDACGGDDDGRAKPSGTVEVEPSRPTPPSSAPSGRVIQRMLGESLISGDSRVTVYTWEQPAALPQAPSGISGPQPPAGEEFAAADVEQCATDQAQQPINANEFSYKVVGPDNVHQSADPGYRMPPFRGAMLYAGDCIRGWVTFSVPVGQRPAYVQWDALGALGAPPLRWRL